MLLEIFFHITLERPGSSGKIEAPNGFGDKMNAKGFGEYPRTNFPPPEP
jgi:hypothetical protein